MKSRTDNISSEAKTSKGIAYDSRWMIISVIVLTLFLFCLEGRAQLVSSNPMEYVALAEGNELINSQIKNQIEDQQKTALLQNTIAAEFTQIRQWERKYNSYLKTVSGYASTLKACSHLYDDGVRIFINLCDLKKAISQNPHGIVATMSMNNLYIETATELITVYSILKDAVAKGGASNMLTGAERSKILWELNDRLAQFNKRRARRRHDGRDRRRPRHGRARRPRGHVHGVAEDPAGLSRLRGQSRVIWSKED